MSRKFIKFFIFLFSFFFLIACTNASEEDVVIKLYCQVGGNISLAPDSFANNLCERVAGVLEANIVVKDNFEEILLDSNDDDLIAFLDVRIVGNMGIEYSFTKDTSLNWRQGLEKQGDLNSIVIMDTLNFNAIIDQLINDFKRLV